MTPELQQLTKIWGDGEYTFRLPLGQLRELQDKTQAGPYEVLMRIRAGTWRLDDVRETVRLGLIGGGLPPPAAFQLVARYVDQRPLIESVGLAAEILAFAILGPEDDTPGKAAAAGEDTAAPAESSPSPPSTAPLR